jgi:hypothetical protein
MHTCAEVDLDNPVGQITMRKGSSKKYSDNFTDILSAFEYKYPTSGEVILIFNDNGTLKWYKDGTLQGSLTLPSGSALAANFRNQYIGFKDGVRITAGSGSTNHVLGFYYLNSSIFNAAQTFTGYKLTRAQILPTYGSLSRVKSITYDETEGHYWVGFKDSIYVEKRDINFRFLERVLLVSDWQTFDSTAVYETTVHWRNDKLYCHTSNGALGTARAVYKLNAQTLELEATSAGTWAGITGMVADNSNVWVAARTSGLFELTASDMTTNSSITASINAEGVAADSTTSASNVFTYNNDAAADRLEKYSTTTLSLSTSDNTFSAGAVISSIEVDGSEVICVDSANEEVREFLQSTLAHQTTTAKTGHGPELLVKVFTGPNVRLLGTSWSHLEHYNADTLISPALFNLTADVSSFVGNLDTGTFFYKMAVEDVDGQVFPLSDPSHIASATAIDVRLTISCNDDELDTLYRVKRFHIFRAYSSDRRAPEEATSYRQVKTVEVDASGWQNDSGLGIYYYDLIDSTKEADISDVTYQEFSGLSEQVIAYPLNYKFMVWAEDRLHAANFYWKDQTYPVNIARSVINGPDVIADDVNTYACSVGGGDDILAISRTRNRVVVFQNKTLCTFLNGQADRELFPGLNKGANGDSLLARDDVIVYIADTGLFSLTGNQVSRISDPVRTSFDQLTDFTHATVFLFDQYDRIIFSFFHAQNGRSLVHNPTFGTWTKYLAGFAFRGYFRNDSGEYIGWNAANFMKLLEDTTDDSTDIASSVTVQLNHLTGADGRVAHIYSLAAKTNIDTTNTPKIETAGS